MRKLLLILLAFITIGLAVLVALRLSAPPETETVQVTTPAATNTPMSLTATPNGVQSALPAVFAPAPTASPPPPSPTSAPTVIPSPSPVPTATAEPLPGNALANGSFEEPWTDLPPAPGYLINQQPAGWSLRWLEPGEPLWDDPEATAQGVPECLHKLALQLPPEEQPDGDRPLILDGTATYKMFHFGAPFGSQLHQTVSGLAPGSVWRFTVPVQAHAHGDDDPWAAESGVWVITSETQAGGWAPAGNMGDRTWFFHHAEFVVPEDGQVELLIRVKSKWFRPKDFFIDRTELRQLAGVDPAPYRRKVEITGDSVTWGPRPLQAIPRRELVTP